MAVAFVAMVPLVIVAEKRRRMKTMCLGAIVAITLSLIGLAGFAEGLRGLMVWLLVFFTAFNLLEATLPSMLSKLAPAGAKGTAMGLYSTSQFLGASSVVCWGAGCLSSGGFPQYLRDVPCWEGAG